jgi:hypothetical protein
MRQERVSDKAKPRRLETTGLTACPRQFADTPIPSAGPALPELSQQKAEIYLDRSF